VIRRRKRVLILGCGPAGLFAAQAAKNAGADYRILSKRRKSEMFGAQFLQSPIAGIIDYAEQFQVHFKLSGDFLDYSTIEWPEVNRPPLDDVVKISKPIATSCNCWEGRDFIKAGRYGAWHWAGQSHHSYVLTTKALR
jgi:hypothetical protein